MKLAPFDWVVMAAYGLVVLIVGLWFTRRAGQSTTEYFLGGRNIPWWVLGTSMVATTFSTDTPNLVTDIVRTSGVSGNWVWWAFVLTGMLTVFFYARLWRRSGVLTDMQFYELRYSGRPAAFLRGFRAVYLGVFFNVVIMATVTLAAIKIGGVLLGVEPLTVVAVAGSITLLYSATSGLLGVVATDLVLFAVAMVGSIGAAVVAVGHPKVGGLQSLMSNPDVVGRLSFLPDFGDPSTAVAVFIVPIAVQWWSTWYPGSEPGGGGYAAQRMLAARNETDALKAVLWFNVAHYALRPWPWVIVALASVVVYPDLAALREAFPNIDASIVRNDLAYPAMLTFLPAGLLGLVVASLAAAYMSTISTHLNWGASYVVEDVYRRFVASDRDEAHYVRVARVTTVALTLLMGVVALQLESALQAFQILLQIGAGTGLVFLLRWFWWRINAWSEISAMVISFAVALWFAFAHTAAGFAPLDPSLQLVFGVVITTAGWLAVTFATRPTERATLESFYRLIRPMGRGWRQIVGLETGMPESDHTPEVGALTRGVASWFFACVAVYGTLFATGFWLYGTRPVALLLGVVALASAIAVARLMPREVMT